MSVNEFWGATNKSRKPQPMCIREGAQTHTKSDTFISSVFYKSIGISVLKTIHLPESLVPSFIEGSRQFRLDKLK